MNNSHIYRKDSTGGKEVKQESYLYVKAKGQSTGYLWYFIITRQ